MLVGESVLSLSRQNVSGNLSDITQRNRRELVGIAERSGERMLLAHLLCIEEGVLGVEAGTGDIVSTSRCTNTRSLGGIPDHNWRMPSDVICITFRGKHQLLQINEFA